MKSPSWMITYGVTLNPRWIPANPTGPALVRLATAAPVINDTDSAARRKQSRTFCRIYFRAEGERGRQAREGEGGVREGRGESYRREIVIVNLARKAGRQAEQRRGAQCSARRPPRSLTNEGAGLFINLVSSRLLGQISLPAQQQLHPPRGGDGRRRWRGPRGSPRNLNGKGPELALAPVS